jgi:hypothetical protein
VPLENWKTVAEVIRAAITSVAVLVGGIWAYFKLVKGPHLQITCRDWDRCLSARNGDHLSLQVCLRLETIGGAKVRLQWEGVGVQLSHMAIEQEDSPAEMRWRR